MSWHQIQNIFPGLLHICAKFEEIPSTSKDAIGRQTCGAGGYGGPFRENSSHMQTSVPHRTLKYHGTTFVNITVKYECYLPKAINYVTAIVGSQVTSFNICINEHRDCVF